jgi:hypothetical protein
VNASSTPWLIAFRSWSGWPKREARFSGSTIIGTSIRVLCRIERQALTAATCNCFDSPRSNRGNHRPIVGAPVAPHIAAPVPTGSATQTAGAVTITAMAVTGSTTEAAAKVIAAKTVTTTIWKARNFRE